MLSIENEAEAWELQSFDSDFYFPTCIRTALLLESLLERVFLFPGKASEGRRLPFIYPLLHPIGHTI